MGISLGLVGLGSFGRVFAPLYAAHPGVDRLILCDADVSRAVSVAEHPTVRRKCTTADITDSYQAVLDSNVDAIVLITQPWLHAPQACEAMQHGKDVYSAVPVLSVPDGDEILDWCDRLVQCCTTTGKHYMMGETSYYRAPTVFARKFASRNGFGAFIHAEGDYWHSFDWPLSDLRKVKQHREVGKVGKEAAAMLERYHARGIRSGPMHYPTHSTSGPMCVMNAHATRVSCIGMRPTSDDDFFAQEPFSNQTAFFEMSNKASMRICEFRDCGQSGRESFRLFGTDAFFNDGHLVEKGETGDRHQNLDEATMRPDLPDEVHAAISSLDPDGGAYGGHGGSHAYLVHEFVSAVTEDRHPTVNIWEAVRYMAAGVMAHKSALRDAEWLDVPDWGDCPES